MKTRRLTGWLALIVLVCAIAVLVYFEFRQQGPEPLPAAVSTSEPGPDESDSPAATTAEAPQPAAEGAGEGAPDGTPAATAEAPAAGAETPPVAVETPPAATETPAAPAATPTEFATAEPTPAAEPAPAAVPSAAQGIPSFDIVRVEPTGDTVVAGQAGPKARVEILDGTETIAVAEANDEGEWAIPLDKPLPPGTHDLAIRTTSADQKTVTLSDQRVAVSVPSGGSKDVLVVLNAPDAASRVLQEPPADTAAGASPPAPQGQPSEVAAASGGEAGSAPAPETPQATADGGSAPAAADRPAAASGGGTEATADAGPATSPPAPTAADGAASPAPAEQQIAAAPTQPEPAGPAPSASAGTESGGTSNDQPPAAASTETAASPPAPEPAPSDTEIAAVEPPADSNPPAADQGQSPAAQPAAEAPAAEAPAAEPPAEAAAPAEPPAPAPPPPEVGVASVEADTSGALFVSGTTNAAGTIRVYMEDELLGEAHPDASGAWTLQATRDMPAGTYRVRADGVDETGAVVARAEVPFEREVEVAILKPVGGAGAATGTKVAGAMPMQTLVIKKGDNLWRLSRTWYGKGKRWATLYTANKDQIRNPRWIYPGQVFMIPAGDTRWKN